MLTQLCLTNYRNLRLDGGINFDPLTVFVGPNGFGKTNVLRALRFIRDSWTGTPEERRGITRFQAAAAQWGGSNILDATITPPAVVEIDMDVASDPDFVHGFVLGITATDNTTIVRYESLIRRYSDQSKERPYKYYDALLDQNRTMVSMYAEGSTRSSFVSAGELPANELAIHTLQSWLEQHSDNPSKETPFFEGKKTVSDFVRDWEFFDSSQMSLNGVRQARQEIGLGDTRLTPTGENLPLVLFNLFSKDIEFQERILRAMAELFPDTRAFRTNVVGRVSLTVEWYRKDIKRPFFLDEMSDGTIRMLCWATVLLSPELPSLIVLDEPEASIHPAWLQILAGWIREAARKTQVIVSTHSSDLLDYFTEDAASVRVFGRDAENPTYATVHALDPARVADKFAEGWKLGDLYRVGDPELGGWPW